MEKITLFWFRRDLRLHDNIGLYAALKKNNNVLPIFIFDSEILNDLEKNDTRVSFIYQCLIKINNELLKINSSLLIKIGHPTQIFEELIQKYSIGSVYTNHDYEPYAKQRDESVKLLLQKNGIQFHTFKDQVIFEKNEVTKDDGTPYTVYTPYSKKWKTLLALNPIHIYSIEKLKPHFHNTNPFAFPSLQEIGFEENKINFPSLQTNENIILNYHNTRDYPAIQGTSQLSVHLRFGTISIRELVFFSINKNEKFLNELIWRDFYQMILWHFPHVVTKSFKPQYDNIILRNNEQEFTAWCNGKTGYQIVDAGMRELNETGWMHNRVRMIVASFLTKHLLIDWRWGEAYFAKKLNDFDLASNNGGWQWAAGSGCDAAPYFRVFNPYIQTKKFDEHLQYIKKWIPELNSFDYPQPIVEHDFARKRCLETYKLALQV